MAKKKNKEFETVKLKEVASIHNLIESNSTQKCVKCNGKCKLTYFITTGELRDLDTWNGYSSYKCIECNHLFNIERKGIND